MLTTPQSIVLSERFAQRHDLRLGAPIHLYTSQGTQRLIVQGLLRPEGAAAALGGHFAIMDIAAAQVLFNRVGRLDRIDVVPRPDFPLETCRSAATTPRPRRAGAAAAGAQPGRRKNAALIPRESHGLESHRPHRWHVFNIQQHHHCRGAAATGARHSARPGCAAAPSFSACS